jgi:hypothetical protein
MRFSTDSIKAAGVKSGTTSDLIKRKSAAVVVQNLKIGCVWPKKGRIGSDLVNSRPATLSKPIRQKSKTKKKYVVNSAHTLAAGKSREGRWSPMLAFPV